MPNAHDGTGAATRGGRSVLARRRGGGYARGVPVTVERWGRSTDLAVLDRLVHVQGRALVDVGCGAGALARALAERGAGVLGVEPDPVQAARNRAVPESAGVTFAEGRAEALPAGDGACDGVIFGRSLHHVPQAAMRPALAEARRVLGPGGFLYVLEPVMAGSFSAVMKPFHDETEVRRLARAALADSAPLFAGAREIHYEVERRFASHAAFVDQFAGLTYNSYGADAVRSDSVKRLFEAGRTDAGDYAFVQPMRVDLFHTNAG